MKLLLSGPGCIIILFSCLVKKLQFYDTTITITTMQRILMNRKQSTGEKHKQLLIKTLRTYRPDKVEFINMKTWP